MPRSLESELTALRAQVTNLQELVYGLLGRSGKPIPAERWLNVELDSALSAGGSVTCNVMDWNGTEEVDSGSNVTAYDRGYQVSGVAGNKALVRWNHIAQRWELVQVECEQSVLASADVPAETVPGEIESDF